jgi:hypothetical protein
MIHNTNKIFFHLSNMNRKFMFSMGIAISFFVGSGFVIASQTVMAVQFSYPYSNSAYNKAYNSNNTLSSDNSAYNKANNPNNNDRNDRDKSFYDNSAYNKANNPNNNDRNDRDKSFYDNSAYNKAYNSNNNDSYDKYSDSYSKFAGYSKYPRNDKIHECQKGHFEGFFTSSVEFCLSK